MELCLSPIYERVKEQILDCTQFKHLKVNHFAIKNIYLEILDRYFDQFDSCVDSINCLNK